MAAASRLAARARPISRPNPAVGALLVREGRVIARGWTQDGGRPHAEAMALDALEGSTEDATLYVTLEPCAHKSERGPACADLIVESRPARVVIGQRDPATEADEGHVVAGARIFPARQSGQNIQI